MHIEGIVFDMDGVLRFGNRPATNVNDVIKSTTRQHIPAMVLTNECRYTEEKIRTDLISMGVGIPESWKIYSSAMAARDFILKLALKDYNTLFAVGVIGDPGLKETIYEIEQLKTCKVFDTLPENSDVSKSIKILVIGCLSKLSNDIIEKCHHWIKYGAKIITTCPDLSDPGYCNVNFVCPAKIIHMLSFNDKPISHYNVGKPNPTLRNIIKKNLNINSLNKVLFVGDTINTDIKFAIENNMISCYIISSGQGAEELTSTIHYPDFVFKDLDSLKKLIDEVN